MAEGRAVDRRVLQRMTEALHSRGPDAADLWTQGPVGLGHARLSIVDLAGGAQPMSSAAGTVISYNGEIYNAPELRAALPGYRFRTLCDTEVILAVYETFGPEGFERLRGMFAFALHDPVRDLLVLHRDRFGIKPLYLLDLPQGVAFASSPKAFVQAGLAVARVADGPLQDWLARGYCLGEDALLAGVRRVLPGELVTIAGGRRAESRLPALALPRRSPPPSRASALVQLDEVLLDSVRLHCRADVPYGLFLSGGVDSSAILVAHAKLGLPPIQSFTIGFDVGPRGGKGGDAEPERARRLAQRFGSEHQALTFTEADCWTYLPRVAAYMEDPVADYAALPTWKLAETAAQSLKVVLCGEGGDEVFAGYGRYRQSWLRSWLRRLRGRESFAPVPERSAFRPAGGGPGPSRLVARQLRDLAETLPAKLLLRLDNCLMAHGLEGRTPFLDREVLQFGLGLPDRLRLSGGTGKLLLKTWLQREAPEAGAFDRKRGFTVPVAHWMERSARRLAGLLADNRALRLHLPELDAGRLFREARRETAGLRWQLLFFAVWHALHIEMPGCRDAVNVDTFALLGG
ncbi:asparagine synthase (glutamine-hydrolysing) [Tistlia consotensis]|uniref:asparagine synthase (glutamine-hydrolyzing) n=2 Tax=Tistlia TaxID=1321364 RepID=A0A1Y6CQV9_9PROT|nr:asparagine synthase (glutamine-hydrolysing) [Tistlia consotensis USBA 355]SNS04982.1 asparagine synthase (glutamine-hydrolysing) [Tistlia consotensis]